MSKHSVGEWWSEAKRLEVVVSYLTLGNATMVEVVTGVPSGTIRQWKTQPWWKELAEQIQQESDTELDSKLHKRIERVLDLVQDRLENGDYLYDPRTGGFVRKPVSLRDGWKAGKEMFDVRMILRKSKPDSVNQEAVSDILKGLALEFATMAKKRLNERVIDAESIAIVAEAVDAEFSVGVSTLPRETNSDQAPVDAEQGTASIDETRPCA